jgi:tetratricopeptide (TPR) repeat protein
VQYELALVRLAAGDRDGYRQACQAILQEARETDNPLSASFAAWTCSLGAGALDDYETAISLATKAYEANPDNNQFLNTLGAVLYRAERTVEALPRLADLDRRLGQSTASAEVSSAYAWYFLAMTHQKAGDTEQAQEYLQKANEDTERVLADPQNPPPWNRKLTLELLRKEAESVVGVPQDVAPVSETNKEPERKPSAPSPADRPAKPEEDKK